MADEPQELTTKKSVCTFLSGILACAFLGWTCWLVTAIVLQGIPEASRADLAATGLLAATGTAVSSIVAARAAQANPFDFISGWFTAIRGMVFRR